MDVSKNQSGAVELVRSLFEHWLTDWSTHFRITRFFEPTLHAPAANDLNVTCFAASVDVRRE